MEWVTVIVWIRHTQTSINEKKRNISISVWISNRKAVRSHPYTDTYISACARFFPLLALLSDSKSLLYSYAILEFYFSFNFDLGCSIEENHKSHMQQVFELAKIPLLPLLLLSPSLGREIIPSFSSSSLSISFVLSLFSVLFNSYISIYYKCFLFRSNSFEHPKWTVAKFS